MKKLNKNSADEDSLNCLVIGTEDENIYIVESEAFYRFSNGSLLLDRTISNVFFRSDEMSVNAKFSRRFRNL